MGDGGALFLGFVLAALAIKLSFRGRPPSATWMVPVLVLAVPLFDLTLVMVSRIRRGVNPFTTAGKDHLSHRLVRRGATTREAILAIYLLGCAAGTLAVFVSQSAPLEATLVLAAVLLMGAWSLWRLESQTPSGSQEDRTHDVITWQRASETARPWWAWSGWATLACRWPRPGPGRLSRHRHRRRWPQGVGRPVRPEPHPGRGRRRRGGAGGGRAPHGQPHLRRGIPSATWSSSAYPRPST